MSSSVTTIASPPTTAISSSDYKLIPSLPDDVALNCLARLPRSHYRTLSLVSKSIRSLLSSSLYFNVRSHLQCTEHFLYLSMRLRPQKNHSASLCWFTLNVNPLNSSKPYILVPVPPNPSPKIGSAYAVIGPRIYVIGGSTKDIASPHVWILDCRFNTWQPGPAMRIGREFAAAGVIDGKIYVLGGCVADTWAKSTNWAEVLDPETGRWETVPSPVEVREKWMHASAVMDDKVFAMADRGGVAYDPTRKMWESVGSELDVGWRGRACVIDGVLYCYDYLGNVKGFDVKYQVWKELKGLGKTLPKFLCGATMANVGGKLVVVWESKGNWKDMGICCAEIDIQRQGDGELLGNIDWYDKVLSVPKGSSIMHCSAVAF